MDWPGLARVFTRTCFAWVLRGAEHLLLLFARVFRWYLSKRMQIQANPHTQVLKPTRLAAKANEKASKIDQMCLKTMRIAANLGHERARRRAVFEDPSPSVEEACLTHPHSFASPARTNESKSKSKSISRFGGAATRAYSLPLNLRFFWLARLVHCCVS